MLDDQILLPAAKSQASSHLTDGVAMGRAGPMSSQKPPAFAPPAGKSTRRRRRQVPLLQRIAAGSQAGKGLAPKPGFPLPSAGAREKEIMRHLPMLVVSRKACPWVESE
jgi:hypothetical protein